MNPPCQTLDCDGVSRNLLRSKKEGIEIYLCNQCARDYHKEGWELVKGVVELK